MKSFEGALQVHPELFFFTPLVAAVAGNVGVQSSAIIVQGLANDNVTGSLWLRLLKETCSKLRTYIWFWLVIKFNCSCGNALCYYCSCSGRDVCPHLIRLERY